MKQIKLTKGQNAIVDDVDFEWLNQWKWYANKGCNTFYAQRKLRINKKCITVIMHREILGLKYGDGKCVDHIDGNGLYNKRSNLRICTNSQNQHNQKVRISGTSQFKGVTWNKGSRKWQSLIRYNGKKIHLGLFSNEIEAAKAYNKKALELFGEFALLNQYS